MKFFLKDSSRSLVFVVVVVNVVFCIFLYIQTCKVHLKNSDVNLGEQNEQEAIPFKFEIDNPTFKDLFIANIASDCGCVNVRSETPLVESRNKLFVTGSLLTPKVDSTQSIQKEIIIQLTDGTVLKGIIRASVRPVISLSKKEIAIGRLKANESKRFSVALINSEKQPWSPKVSQLPDGVLASMDQVSESEAHLVIDITKKAMLIEDFTKKELLISTSYDKKPTLTLRLSGERDRLLTANPTAVNFGIIESDKAPKKEIQLTHATLGNDFKILEIRSQNKQVTGEVRRKEKAAIIEVSLEAANLKPDMFFDDILIIKTNAPDAEEIAIPVYGAIRPASL